MADNTTLNTGTGGDVIATDDITTLNGGAVSGVKAQRVKVGFGVDAAFRDVESSNPLPVDTELPAAAALADATANPTVPSVGTFIHVWNGTTWDRSRGSIDTVQTAQSIAATSGNAVTVSSLNGYGGVAVQITGTWTGTVTFEASVDGGTTYFSNPAIAVNGTGVLVTTATGNGQWQSDIAGFSNFRIRCSITGTGTAVISIRASLGAAAVAIDSPLPAGTNIIGALSANQSANVAQINGVTPLMGSGATGTGSQRVTLATDGQGQIVDNAAFTDTTTRVDMVGFIFDEVAGTALTENDAAAGRIDSKRAQVMVVEDATTRGQRQAVNAAGAAAVVPNPQTTGGLSISRVLSAASTNGTSAKASAGQVYTIIATNINAAVRYLKIYNKASAPTVGTDTPVLTIPIPGNAAGAGFTLDTGGMGIAFATGIAYALTTGVADADTGAVAANEIVVNLLYK